MGCIKRNIIRDGTSQNQRLLPASDPGGVRIDDRNTETLLVFLAEFSKQIAYRNNSNGIEGDWSPFISDVEKLAAVIALAEKGTNPEQARSVPPHQAILLAFLHLFAYLQKDLNNIAKRHLNFYYSKVLFFQLNNATPDRVHILFELAKGVGTAKINAGGSLLAGKDAIGREQIYRIDREIVVNQGVVEEVKTLFVQKDKSPRFLMSSLNSKKIKALTDTQQLWEPFGAMGASLSTNNQIFETTTIGWAIASPLLRLQEGKRSIKGLINCSAAPNVILTSKPVAQYLVIDVSTELGWKPVQLLSSNRTQTANGADIDFDIEIPASFPAITTSPDPIWNRVTQWPAIRFTLRPDAPNLIYQEFQETILGSISLRVSADEVKSLTLYNDFGLVETGKPFQPFGAVPRTDATFYVGNNEAFLKELDSLGIVIKWNNIPQANLGNYYRGYFKDSNSHYLPEIVSTSDPDPIDNKAFTAIIEQLVDGQWVKINTPTPLGLFDTIVAGNPAHFQTNQSVTNLDLQHFSTKINNANQSLLAPPQAKEGYLAIRLQPTNLGTASKGISAFGHDEFATVFSEIAIGKATSDPNFATVGLPNQPYTPIIKEILLSYESVGLLDFAGGSPTAQFIHIEPFGITDKPTLRTLIPVVQEEGYLFLGIDKLVPPQNISFLFQLEEGTNDPDKPLKSEDLQWSYLAGNNWTALNRQSVISDTTRGFQVSGIVELSVGADASIKHSLMPSDLHWLRCRVAANSAGACEIVALHSQAASAVYLPPSSAEYVLDLENLELEPFDLTKHILAENSIRQLAAPEPGIKSVRQPFPSFDGSSIEALGSYYARVSERLRHRNRPVALWDYERLILHAFPEIYKVKCLPHTNPVGTPLGAKAPGHVTLVVVPSFFGRERRVLQPRANSVTLARIQDYLELQGSVQAKVHVVNPVYERILLYFKVGFYENKDPGYYSKTLNEELVRFLSPWAFDTTQDIIFGGSFTRSDVIDFIEKRDYVDFVADLHMYSTGTPASCPGIGEMFIVDPVTPQFPIFTVYETIGPGVGAMAIEDNFIVGEPLEVLSATSELSIIVSSERHLIRPVQKNICSILPGAGIGTWLIEIDFIVQNN